MTALPTRAVTAESVKLLNEAFDARLKAHQAKRSARALEAHIFTSRADALMRAARTLETAAMEMSP